MNRIDVILSDHERGLLKEDGRLKAWLEPGRHRRWSWRSQLEVERVNLDQGWWSWSPELEALIPKGAAEILHVPGQQIAALTKEDRPHRLLNPGRYLLWKLRGEISVELYSTEDGICAIPEPFWKQLGDDFEVIEVKSHEGALLSIDGRLDRRLEAGRHLLCQRHHTIKVDRYDLREAEFQIVGQEVMTADKVTLRVNAIVKHRILDPMQAAGAVVDLPAALYSEAQMAIRGFMGSRPLEQLLERQAEAKEAMTAPLRERAEAWGVEVRSVDLKDIVLPGEMKAILNQVIEAEKRAEANGILRREETAATRSQANTARVLANNPVLLRLKELEALKEIAERVDHVSVVAGGAEGLGRLFSLRGLAAPSPEDEG